MALVCQFQLTTDISVIWISVIVKLDPWWTDRQSWDPLLNIVKNVAFLAWLKILL